MNSKVYVYTLYFLFVKFSVFENSYEKTYAKIKEDRQMNWCLDFNSNKLRGPLKSFSDHTKYYINNYTFKICINIIL